MIISLQVLHLFHGLSPIFSGFDYSVIILFIISFAIVFVGLLITAKDLQFLSYLLCLIFSQPS